MQYDVSSGISNFVNNKLNFLKKIDKNVESLLFINQVICWSHNLSLAFPQFHFFKVVKT